MKRILFTFVLLISALSFAQNKSSITGKILDIESNNEPLAFATISIKETGTKVLSDTNGVFTFQNLEVGTYTLVYSFVGYENKELPTEVISEETTNITLTLGASTLSLDDIMMSLASADASSVLVSQ